jgi:hypothetical protein
LGPAGIARYTDHAPETATLDSLGLPANLKENQS